MPHRVSQPTVCGHDTGPSVAKTPEDNLRAKLQNFLRSYDLSLTSTNAPLLRDMQPRAKVPTQTQMPFRTKRQHLRLAATLAFLPSLFLTGCEDIQFWKDKEGAVSVYGTHHQEPDDKGKIPDAGSTSFRSFTSNVGWEIQLTSAFVVTAETDLAPCMSMSSDEERAGGEIPADTSKLTSVNMTCGSCSENFIGKPDKTNVSPMCPGIRAPTR